MEGKEKGRKEAVETNVVHSGLFDTQKKLYNVRKAKGRYRTYSIPGKTAALVPVFAVEDLPSAELQPRFLCQQ